MRDKVLYAVTCPTHGIFFVADGIIRGIRYKCARCEEFCPYERFDTMDIVASGLNQLIITGKLKEPTE